MILTYGTLKGMLVPLSKRILGHLAVLGILQTSLTYILFYIGLSNTTGVKGSILIGTGTFFAIIFAHFYYHDDKLSLNKILGLVVGFIGVIIISLSKGSLDFGFKFTGEGFMIISSMVTAVASLYAKELSKEISPVIIAGFQMLIGATLLIVFSGQQIGYTAIAFKGISYLLLVYLAFISATAFTLWFTLIKHNKIGKITIYKFQVPIWGAILSSTLLPGESLNIGAIIALGFVVLGIVLVNLDQPLNRYLKAS